MARDLSASQGPVLVGLSGGVDSSYAAFCLRQEGFSVIGVSLQVWDYSECDVRQGIGTCCSHLDVEEARFVATQLGIPFYVLDVKPQFQESIVKPFVDQYVQGQTPLPCAWCNRHVKLRELVEKMFLWDCHQVATGHYARRGLWQGFPVIQKAVDELKDQTYFLFDIPREWISYLRFPLGDFTKTQVREMAQQAGLINARKKDSQGICFVGNQSYTEFIERKFPYKIHPSHEGPIRLYPSGQVLGYHQGYWRYTVGQARGLGLGYHEKLFVLSVDPATATVWVGPEAYLWQKGFWVTNLQWHVPFESLKNQAIWAKIRANHPGARVAHWELTDEGLYVEFENSQKAITPGQAAVFYVDNQFLVGGGWIKKSTFRPLDAKLT